MEYQKASQIRKKSLLTLIGEKKFEQGKGLGSSIGGAISDKFKAKATGIKESLDPLNWLSSMVGQGGFGRMVTTAGGRIMGKSDEDIKYFGGYAGKKKKKGKKDPQITSVGAGAVKPLQVGDSIADILGKMYNFMEKTHEIYKLNYEIETAFRQEQMDEDERRHKKLIESITGKKVKPEEKDGVESFIKKLLEGITKTLGFLLTPLITWAGKLEKWILNIINPAQIVEQIGKFLLSSKKILLSLAGIILDAISPAIGAMVTAMVAAAIAVQEYEKWRSESSRATEALTAAKALDKGPSIEKGKVTEDITKNLKPEQLEEYKKGNLKLYDHVIIPDTGGKSSQFFLQDDEVKTLSKAFMSLAASHTILQKIKNGDIPVPEDDKFNEIKQSIVDNKLIIGTIEKTAISRQPLYKSNFGYSSFDINEDISTLLNQYSKPTAIKDMDKGFWEKEIDSIFPEDKKNIFKLPEFPRFGIPTQLSEDEILQKSLGKNEQIINQNSTNVIGQKSPAVINVNGVRMRDSSTQDCVRKSTVPC